MVVRKLICMRLADMKRVHPEQITKRCSKCNEEVGVYPSGQRVLADGVYEIVCHICQGEVTVGILAPGAALEPFESKRRE